MLTPYAVAALSRAVVHCFTLYMLLILLRWTGPWLELDLYGGRLRWIPQLTDPLFNQMRRILPAMGPVDFAPLASLLIVWLVRQCIVLVIILAL